MEPKKIFINKSDSAATVAKKIAEAKEDSIVLHIPRFSALAESVEHFEFLVGASVDAGKVLRVESVDDRAVEFARAAGIDADNPFFRNAQRPMADIVTRPMTQRIKARATFAVAPAESASEVTEEEARMPGKDSRARLAEEEAAVAEELNEQFGPLSDERPKRRLRLAKAVIVFAALSSVAAALGLKVLPRADIQIVTAKESWKYADVVIADKSLSAPISDPVKVPGQLFTEKRNVTLTFPASGKRDVAMKANGTMSIINAYSSEAQKLVATTRFISPDGKVFRLIKAVTVPGAKIIDGKIVPSSIDAEVAADKAGEEYNIAAGTSFTIPGFKGTPKYAAFRGEAKTAISGGFLGVRAYPTDDDIKKAKDAIAATLAEGLKTAISAKIPKEFKVIEGSNNFRIVKQTVDTMTNEAGAFSVTADAEMSVMAMRESDIMTALHTRLIASKGSEFEIKEETLAYGTARFEAGAGRMTIPVDYNATIARRLNPEALKNGIRAKSETDVRAMVMGIKGLDRARIHLWPFWVRTVPDDGTKIRISIE